MGHPTITSRLRVTLVLVGLTAALVATGCSGSSDSDNASGGGARDGATGDASGGGSESAEADLSATGGPLPQTPGASARQEIIRTARIRVATDDPVADAAAVRRLAGPGGRVGAERRGEGHVSVTLLVVPARFDTTLDAIGSIGEVESRAVDTEDVTAQVVDLELRLEGARRKAGRLQALLDRAGSLAELVQVEQALGNAETEVERLESQERAVRDRIDLATIEVTLAERSEPAPSSDIPGFSRGLRTGGAAVANLGRVAITGFGFAPPFLALLVPIGAVTLLARRRRRGPAAAA